MTDETSANWPLIGRDVGWDAVTRHVLRILDFNRLDTIIGQDGKVKASSATDVYGVLLVESPVLNGPAVLPIGHKDDFWLAASVLDEREKFVPDGVELLVTYVPKRKLPFGFGGFTHALHYLIVPSGTLERFYEGAPHRRLRPDPEVLFGEFVYSGAINVKANASPKV